MTTTIPEGVTTTTPEGTTPAPAHLGQVTTAAGSAKAHEAACAGMSSSGTTRMPEVGERAMHRVQIDLGKSGSRTGVGPQLNSFGRKGEPDRDTRPLTHTPPPPPKKNSYRCKTAPRLNPGEVPCRHPGLVRGAPRALAVATRERISAVE